MTKLIFSALLPINMLLNSVQYQYHLVFLLYLATLIKKN